MAGYSGTPLVRKLGIKAGSRVFAASAPPEYRALLAPMPEHAKIVARLDDSVELLHLFATKKLELERFLRRVLPVIRRDAAIWVSWPKKSAKVPTDINEDTIRAVALPMGLVDIKVCAVDDVWSGLKLVIRKSER